jgi:hypothetical protein
METLSSEREARERGEGGLVKGTQAMTRGKLKTPVTWKVWVLIRGGCRGVMKVDFSCTLFTGLPLCV